MRNCIADMCEREYCILREENVREKRGIYNGSVIGCIPSFAG
jgi:hypothetical protein